MYQSWYLLSNNKKGDRYKQTLNIKQNRIEKGSLEYIEGHTEVFKSTFTLQQNEKYNTEH